ncbi:MAG: sugar phosphate isomerase/epimerase [Pleurocapsa minor GSE-CHR-MK-17-07R]|jgi:sugar phosphate isomerase/epimerase|nr:sugar phosphate isomerase/epimerase [Pleurocapsa minor GSE-CHR-MK 17-07R]
MAAFALKFAYSTINWGTKPNLAEMFGEIREAGWGAVELFDHSLDWLGTADHLRGLLGGLHVATFFGGLELPVDQNQLTVHKRRIDYAAGFGADVYGLVGGGRLRWRSPSEAEYKGLADACEELSVYAATRNMRTGYHPHTGCTIETGDEIDILLGHTSKTELCLDASHIALVDEDPIAQVRRYAQRTSYVHVKDWAKGKFVELGQGTLGIDFPGFFAALHEMQFPGWVVVENSRSDVSPAESARINADYLRGLGYSLAVPAQEGA